MRIVEKALLVVIGVAGIGGLVAWFSERPEPSAPTEGADGPCELPAGFQRSKKLVKWNPISAPGRCASSSASLVIDNGTEREIHLDLAGKDVEVAPRDRVTIVTLPGPFAFKPTSDGAVLDEASLELVDGHTYVYNPELAWDYVVERRTYSVSAFVGGGGGDEPVAAALLFEPGPVDYSFTPFPEKVRLESGMSVTKSALQHVGDPHPGRITARGELRVATLRPGHVVVLPRGLTVGGAASASIYLDNADDKHEMSVRLDGLAVAADGGGGHLRLDVPPGLHQVEATTGGKVTRASIEAKSGERWVWTPSGRREYELDTIAYGYAVTFRDPPRRRTARALPPFKTDVDFVFDVPSTVQTSGLGGLEASTSRSVLRRGAVGDFHRAIAREVGKLGGKADPASATECDLFAARVQDAKRRGGEARLELAEQARDDASAFGCAVR